ncbi:MAG: hypothetical protein K2P51_06940 [Rhabdochlamydiaceae bacterium]|nr:hypothetical protein [Rhabdochlamydiaceae bacterium]
MADFPQRDKSQSNKTNPQRELTDAELDKIAKVEADRLVNKFEKRVKDFIEKEKRKLRG